MAALGSFCVAVRKMEGASIHIHTHTREKKKLTVRNVVVCSFLLLTFDLFSCSFYFPSSAVRFYRTPQFCNVFVFNNGKQPLPLPPLENMRNVALFY